jgi:MoaA/NifB/PqqE/SkfB family radical SAM enzyme
MSETSGALTGVRQKLRKLKRHGRYVPKILRYGTPRKIANIMTAEAELRLQKTVLRGLPYYYIIDICNVCNLRCPLCPTGNTKIARKQDMLSLDQYKEIFNKVKDYALVVSIYNHGEPFLNPDAFAIIEHTKRNRVGTNASSNLTWPQPVDVREIVRSGLDYLTVSLDGVTQESYEQYRVRGDIRNVFENMKALVAAKKELNSKTPFIEWQYIVFKHTEHEMEQARRMAEEIGVDMLRFVSPGVQPEDMHDKSLQEKWMPENPLFWERNPDVVEQRGYLYEQPCYYLYRSMFIYTGGGVTPCCFAHDTNHDFGNILTQSVPEIWNNHKYRSARMLFSKKAPSEPRLETLCDKCTVFRQDGAHLCGVRPAHEVFLEARAQAAAAKANSSTPAEVDAA